MAPPKTTKAPAWSARALAHHIADPHRPWHHSLTAAYSQSAGTDA